MGKWLDIGTALFALIAAFFWFKSATGNLPEMVSYYDHTPETDPFRVALKSSAKMNQIAAGFSGLSALCAGLKLFIK